MYNILKRKVRKALTAMSIITKIFWKRTYLFIECSNESAIDIFLRNRESGREVPMEVKSLGNGIYRAKLNITIANGRDLLEAGSWEIIEKDSQKPIPCADCFKKNPYIGQRVFRYTARFYSYTFRLEICGDNVIIKNGHYMSVKREQDEQIFRETFFN